MHKTGANRQAEIYWAGRCKRMGEVVSLNKFRKAKAKTDKKVEARENRIRHGETKAERKERAAVEQLDQSRHAGHVLDDDKKGEE